MNSDIIRLLESKEDSMSRLDYREARASVEWGLKHGLLKKPAPAPERVVDHRHGRAVWEGRRRAAIRRMAERLAKS